MHLNHLARHKRGAKTLIATAFNLLTRRQRFVMPFAKPAAIFDRRRPHACAAVAIGGSLAETNLRELAPATFEIVGRVSDARRQGVGREDDVGGAG